MFSFPFFFFLAMKQSALLRCIHLFLPIDLRGSNKYSHTHNETKNRNRVLPKNKELGHSCLLTAGNLLDQNTLIG
jgi:hypothetical protein